MPTFDLSAADNALRLREALAMEGSEDFDDSHRWLAMDWPTAQAIAAQLQELARIRLDLSRNQELIALLLDQLVATRFNLTKVNADFAQFKSYFHQDPC